MASFDLEVLKGIIEEIKEIQEPTWIDTGITLLRRRRYHPLQFTRDFLEERALFKKIDEQDVAHQGFAEHDFSSLLKATHTARNMATHKLPLTMYIPILALLYGDAEKASVVAEHWDNGGQIQFESDLVGYFEKLRWADYELLRHQRLLPEQRKMMLFLREQPRDASLVDLLNASPKIDGESGNVRYNKLAWGRAWNALPHEHAVLTSEHWDEAYGIVLGTVGWTSALYEATKDYLDELAELTYRHAPDNVRTLLGGTLYATLLDAKKANVLKEDVAKELEPLVQDDSLFTDEHFERFHPAKEAGCFHVDRGHWFVFKKTITKEAEAHRAIAGIMKDPAATTWRIAARYDPWFSDPQVKARTPTGEVHTMMQSYAENPELQHWFELPCVKDAGVVVQGEGDTRVIAMHNTGKTLAEQLQEANTREERETLCGRALEMLAKYHLIVTENLSEVNGIFYASPWIVDYEVCPVIPRLNYQTLIERRVAGIHGERLGKGPFYDDILVEVERIGAFLELGIPAAILTDVDDTNIAEVGIIDLEKQALGNRMYDVARFLFGGSWRLKKDINRAMLRDQYIATLSRWVNDTSVVHNVMPGQFEDHRQKFAELKSPRKMREFAYQFFEPFSREFSPQATPAFIEALTLRSVHALLMEWYCYRPGAETRLQEECQAAAIIATMGETGALAYQCEALQKGTQAHEHARTELAYMVQHSFALMYYQGFESFAWKWKEYLKQSGKIPEEMFKDDPTPLAGTLLPNLSTRIDEALWVEQRENSSISIPQPRLYTEGLRPRDHSVITPSTDPTEFRLWETLLRMR